MKLTKAQREAQQDYIEANGCLIDAEQRLRLMVDSAPDESLKYRIRVMAAEVLAIRMELNSAYHLIREKLGQKPTR